MLAGKLNNISKPIGHKHLNIFLWHNIPVYIILQNKKTTVHQFKSKKMFSKCQQRFIVQPHWNPTLRTPHSFLNLSLRKSLTFPLNSTRLIRTLLNEDKKHLPNQQIFMESQPPANADTSLSTVRCNKPLLFERKKPHSTACRCSQRYSTNWIGCIVDDNF